MHEIYQDFIDLATELLNEFGTDATLLKPGELTGLPHRPEQGPPTRHTIRVFRTSKTITSQNDPRISVSKDSLLILTTGGLVVDDADHIETPDGIYNIKTVREIAPVFVTILWIAEIGK